MTNSLTEILRQLKDPNHPINDYQLHTIETYNTQILKGQPTTSQIQLQHEIWQAISLASTFFVKNFIFCFKNTSSTIVKFYLAKLLNLKINGFWPGWVQQNTCQTDQIFDLIVSNILQYVQLSDQKLLFRNELVNMLNVSMKLMYRHQWKGKMYRTLNVISNPKENQIILLINNIKIVRLVLQDYAQISACLLSQERFSFINQIKFQAESILKSSYLIILQMDKYRSVVTQTIKLLPFVLPLISPNLFLTNYSAIIDNLMRIYCQAKTQEIKFPVLESLELIMSYPTNTLLERLSQKIDMSLAKNMNKLLQVELTRVTITKIKQKKNKLVNQFSNTKLSQRKTLSFFDQQKRNNKEILQETVQNFYCSQQVSQIDQHVLQVVQKFLVAHTKLQAQTFNQKQTVKDFQEKQNNFVLKSFIENLFRYYYCIALKLQNDQAQNIVQTQRNRLRLLDAIKFTLAFAANNEIALQVKSQIEVCSMLMCNLSMCPSYFYHSYVTAKILPAVNTEDELNFSQIIDNIEDIFPQVWNKLVTQQDLIEIFTIEKLDYFLKQGPQFTTERPDLVLGVNRLVWGVKHLMDTSPKFVKIANKVHNKLQNQTKLPELRMSTRFCQPYLSKNQQQQTQAISALLISLDSVNSQQIQFQSFIMRQIMEKIHGVSYKDICRFLDGFQKLKLYQDKNQKNLTILVCLIQFVKKMKDPDLQTLSKCAKKIIQISLGEEQQYPQRHGLIKIECINWILSQFFTFLDEIQRLMQDDVQIYQVNNKSWTLHVSHNLMTQIGYHVIRIFQQYKTIQEEIFCQYKYHKDKQSLLKSSEYKNYDKLTQSFMDFGISYNRAWRVYFLESNKENFNDQQTIFSQLWSQQKIISPLVFHQFQIIENCTLDLQSPKVFKFFTSILQLFCDVLIINQNVYQNYKDSMNRIITTIYYKCDSKIKNDSTDDLQFRLNYYQFYQRIFTNQNIFYALDSKTLKIAIDEVLIKICMDDSIQVVESGIWILQKLFFKFIGIDFNTNHFYDLIWNSLIHISSAVFEIMLMTPGNIFFDELSTIMLHLIQIVCRSDRPLFQCNHRSNAQNLILLMESKLIRQFFVGQEELNKDVKMVVHKMFGEQEIESFKEIVRDLLILTKICTIKAHISMEDSYEK